MVDNNSPYSKYKKGIKLCMNINNEDILLQDAPSEILLRKIYIMKKRPTNYRDSWVLVIEDILLNRRNNLIKKIKEKMNGC